MSRRVRRVLAALGASVLVAALAVACGDDGDPAPTSGSVTIAAENPDTSVRPPVGSFEVTAGSDVLGCMEGTFVDSFGLGLKKELTCTSGTRQGTFTVLIDIDDAADGPGDANGFWSVDEGTGDFAMLDGGGDFSLFGEGYPASRETLTGEIEFTS